MMSIAYTLYGRLQIVERGHISSKQARHCRKGTGAEVAHAMWMTSSHLAPMESMNWMSRELSVRRPEGMIARQNLVNCLENTMTCLGVSSQSWLRLPASAHTADARSTYSRRGRVCARLVHSKAIRAQSEQTHAAVSNIRKHLALLSAIGPLMLAAPAFAQLEALGPAALADSVTVPLILSTLAGGAVFAALQSKDAKDVLAQVAEGAR